MSLRTGRLHPSFRRSQNKRVDRRGSRPLAMSESGVWGEKATTKLMGPNQMKTSNGLFGFSLVPSPVPAPAPTLPAARWIRCRRSLADNLATCVCLRVLFAFFRSAFVFVLVAFVVVVIVVIACFFLALLKLCRGRRPPNGSQGKREPSERESMEMDMLGTGDKHRVPGRGTGRQAQAQSARDKHRATERGTGCPGHGHDTRRTDNCET